MQRLPPQVSPVIAGIACIGLLGFSTRFGIISQQALSSSIVAKRRQAEAVSFTLLNLPTSRKSSNGRER